MTANQNRPVLFSGIQPTGHLMIGNYIGALKNWIALQHDYDCLFCLVDLHALTVRQNPRILNRRCLEFIALYLACGIDLVRNRIFVQSHVPEHTQLMWVLNCYAPMGELNRMTQFKDKSKNHAQDINVGLFDYPVLMASDILLYKTDVVPVGDDQMQHLEFTRHIAQRFNHLYGNVFTIPTAMIPITGSRIMGLQDPKNKMSKTDTNPKNYIALLDPPDLIGKKIKQAVTDSGREIRYNPSKPAVSNLVTIYASITGKSNETIAADYDGKGYARFKSDLAECLIDFLSPIHDRYHTIMSDPAELLTMIKAGAAAARNRAENTLKKVLEVVGLILG